MPIVSLSDQPPLAEGGLVIVGAGAVGLAMAVHLARKGIAVTVLEAGPRQPPANFADVNDGPTGGRPFQGLRNGRMRAYGGTTRLWGGQLVAFDRGDIEAEDHAGRKLWPISHAEVSRWADAAFELLGVERSARDTASLWQRATGHTSDLGAGLQPILTIWLRQPDFTRLFANELENDPKLTVATDAEVRRLRFRDDGSVEAVELASADGEIRELRPGRVVLANGAFEIARLLLRAKAIEPDCPFRDNANVGRWYLDHLHGIAGEIEVADRRAFARLFDNIYAGGRKYSVKVGFADQRDGREINIAGSFNPRLTVRELLADARQLASRIWSGQAVGAALRESLAMARVIVPFAARYLVRQRATTLMGKGVRFGIEAEQRPTWDSYLYLDPAAPPESARVGVHWQVDGGEMVVFKRFAEAFAAMIEANGIGKVHLDPRVVAGDPALLDDFSNSGHYMGGARMAESEREGVVDSDCKVFGCPNLYVAGAAVFPTGSFANSTLTAIAMGLRLADHLAAAGRQ
jgi:choline dehydrogenase-like flavoprotein